jgi:UDP-N-acetyl-D-mannosaminuronate dehydrogenase
VDASLSVGKGKKRGAIVVCDPTLYPEVTEAVCIPLGDHCLLQKD